MKIKNVLSQWNDMPTFVRMYTVGLSIYLVGLLIGLLSTDWYVNIYIFSLFFFGLGFVIETVQTLSAIWHTLFAKAMATFLSLLSILCWWLARTLSSQLINLAVVADPSNFPLAAQAFTTIFFVFLWSILIGTFLLILPLVLIFTRHKPTMLSIFKHNNATNNSKTPAKLPAFVGRLAGSFALFFLIASLLLAPIHLHLGHNIGSIGSTILALTDHYAFSTCTNHNTKEGERVAFLGDKKISVAIPFPEGGYNFEIRECIP